MSVFYLSISFSKHTTKKISEDEKPTFNVIFDLFQRTYVQALDKRNQNIIQSILESPSPVNVSAAEEKARTFYRETAKY